MEKCSKREKKNFTILDNEVLRDKTLSFKAKGLLCVIMGFPEKWEFTVKGIVAISPEGETSVRSTIKELKKAGYCDSNNHYENGKIKYLEYYFSDSKEDVINKRKEWEKAKEEKIKLYQGNLDLENLNEENLNEENLNEENLNEENQVQLNNNINKNKENNKETLNISVKKRIEKKYNGGEPLSEKEIEYYIGMEKNYPRVMKMDKPLLYQQYKILLKERIPRDKIVANLEAMEDWKPLDKHTNALRQLRTFMRRDNNIYNYEIQYVNG